LQRRQVLQAGFGTPVEPGYKQQPGSVE